MWRRCKYKLRQARFLVGPCCRGRSCSHRGLFRLKKWFESFDARSNKRTFLRCSRCARIFWNIRLNWEISGINGGQSLSSLKIWLKCSGSLQLSWHPLVLMTGEYFFICNVYRKWKLNVAAMTVWVVLEYNQTAWPNQETTFTFYKT